MMNINDLKGMKITVMGLGLHGGGIGTIKFLSEAGARLVVTDLKSGDDLKISLSKLKNISEIKYVLGEHREVDFLKTDMVIKNPAIPWTNKYIRLAIENDIPVEIDSSLFFKLCKNKIVGITGTRGKTTTASLICEILREAGLNPVGVGIGQISVLDKLKELEDSSTVVFELSSWRLSALDRYQLSPEIAVLTNIFQDHLNYYADLDEYIRDKKYIFANQKKTDFCVINEDDARLKMLESEIGSQIIKFSKNKIVQKKSVYVSNGVIYSKKENGEEKILDIEEIKIKGNHNINNILAGIGVAQALNIKPEIIRKGILSFTGLPHRLEFVREFDGVRYYNDTAATSPDGTISSLNSFAEDLILIAGGSDKNLNMRELASAIKKKTDRVIFLSGAGTDKLVAELKKMGEIKNCSILDSMDEAVILAKNLAKSGDVVLLSPGTASFGLFLNEFDRGDKFKIAVNNLK